MTSLSSDLFIIRDAEPTDLGFIHSTWLKGLYYGNDWFREIDQEIYCERYHQVVEHIIFGGKSTIKVACLREDPEVILSYAVFEKKEPGHILHWAFTKPIWRKMGIVKSILPQDIVSVTHLTKIGKSIKPK